MDSIDIKPYNLMKLLIQRPCKVGNKDLATLKCNYALPAPYAKAIVGTRSSQNWPSVISSGLASLKLHEIILWRWVLRPARTCSVRHPQRTLIARCVTKALTVKTQSIIQSRYNWLTNKKYRYSQNSKHIKTKHKSNNFINASIHKPRT